MTIHRLNILIDCLERENQPEHIMDYYYQMRQDKLKFLAGGFVHNLAEVFKPVWPIEKGV